MCKAVDVLKACFTHMFDRGCRIIGDDKVDFVCDFEIIDRVQQSISRQTNNVIRKNHIILLITSCCRDQVPYPSA
jgi:hypothetical protein